MNILIACEFSGIVREAFRAKGHNAVSCDLYWSEQEGKHVQMDVVELLSKTEDKWDMMIAHPPCTYLANSGVQHLKKDETRWDKMLESIEFFNHLRLADIPKIAIENPIPHKYALNRIGKGYDQIVQPWWFGHEESKATCLWLKNLPELEPTNVVEPKRIGKWLDGPLLKSNWVDRSRTYQGIANAMAEQWG